MTGTKTDQLSKSVHRQPQVADPMKGLKKTAEEDSDVISFKIIINRECDYMTLGDFIWMTSPRFG